MGDVQRTDPDPQHNLNTVCRTYSDFWRSQESREQNFIIGIGNHFFARRPFSFVTLVLK